MDVTLHLGAHRCATTTFQHYLRKNTEKLSENGIGFWGPHRTRNGLFSGIIPGTVSVTRRDLQKRAMGRVQMNLARSTQSGVEHLVVSDENVIGSVRENIRVGELYCGVGERVARFAAAFDGYLNTIVLNIRSLDTYWASAMAYHVTRGAGLPSAGTIARVAFSRRRWRDVITDIATAAPDARVLVLPFETFAGQPETQLSAITGQPSPAAHAREMLNAAPRLAELRVWLGAGGRLPQGDGKFAPFDTAQVETLREAYADDLMWLVSGADGLASLVADPNKKRAGPTLPQYDMTRGRRYDAEQRRLAGAR